MSIFRAAFWRSAEIKTGPSGMFADENSRLCPSSLALAP